MNGVIDDVDGVEVSAEFLCRAEACWWRRCWSTL